MTCLHVHLVFDFFLKLLLLLLVLLQVEVRAAGHGELLDQPLHLPLLLLLLLHLHLLVLPEVVDDAFRPCERQTGVTVTALSLSSFDTEYSCSSLNSSVIMPSYIYVLSHDHHLC